MSLSDDLHQHSKNLVRSFLDYGKRNYRDAEDSESGWVIDEKGRGQYVTQYHDPSLSTKAARLATDHLTNIQRKVEDHPKTTVALGATSGLIGAGYGLHKYLKNRRKK